MTDSPDLDDWETIRAEGHRLVDEMVDHLAGLAEGPVWRAMPPEARARLRTTLPRRGAELARALDEARELVVPFHSGNTHPRFFGWVQGGGLGVGVLAAILEAGLDANCGGRDHAAVAVEAEVVGWMRELFAFPETASGVFVTGTSQANLLAVLIASRRAAGLEVRQSGLGRRGLALRGYASSAVHGCVPRAFDAAGLGEGALRRIHTDARGRLDIAALERAIAEDRAAGLEPFFVAATVGSVDTGAVDDLEALAALAAHERLWLHADAAYAAMGMLSPTLAPRLRALSSADSIAFDFHKWTQLQYEAGFLLVRDGAAHKAAFASPAAYLRREARGIAAGETWPTDLCLDLSRGFKALKVWLAFKALGADRLGAAIDRTCALARHLSARICAEPALELLAPVELNIVCFRVRPGEGEDGDDLNRRVAIALHERGLAAPSTTTVGGALALRAAIFNHRTREKDVEALVDAVLSVGAELREAAGLDQADPRVGST
jgi:aromatic-L-amino-acid decarboxylase